jgi:hypothetical protein
LRRKPVLSIRKPGEESCDEPSNKNLLISYVRKEEKEKKT